MNHQVDNFVLSSGNYGRAVGCNANQTYVSTCDRRPAGDSKRITAFYQKTGTRDHRSEPEFRDYLGSSQLTEVQAARAGGPNTIRAPADSGYGPLDPRSHPSYP